MSLLTVDSSPVSAIINHVHRCMSAGEYEQAENLAYEGLTQAPRSIELLVQLGSAQLAIGDLDGAQEAVDAAMKVDMCDLALLLLASDISAAKHDLNVSIELATRASAIHPQRAEPHAYLGRLWMMQALNEEEPDKESSLILADQHCLRAFELGAIDISLHLEAATINTLQGDLESAELQVKKALVLDAQDPLANLMMGDLALRAREWVRAESHLAEAAVSNTIWSEAADTLLAKARERGFGVEGRPSGRSYRLGVALGGAIVACMLAFVPTVFAWVAVDSFTGYFPPMWLVGASVPLAPIIVLVANTCWSRYKARRSLAGVPVVEPDLIRQPYFDYSIVGSSTAA